MPPDNTFDYSQQGGEYDIENGCWKWVDDDNYHHRDGDNPAIIWVSGKKRGSMAWIRHGVPHRINGYAYIWTHKDAPEWWVDGVYCRTREQFEAARDAYCEKHNIITSGRATKHANPTP